MTSYEKPYSKSTTGIEYKRPTTVTSDTSELNVDKGGLTKVNWLQDFWNGLTGQTAETERTRETNEANAKSIRETNDLNYRIAQETNQQNREIADQNLAFQKDIQEYNQALQQQIFEREDTAYQRTAEDMRKAGLNPLSMQGTNGAGEAIAMSPLENQYQAQQPAPMQATQYQKAQTMMSPIQAIGQFSSVLGSVINSVESIKTGSVQRDALRTQSDAQRIQTFLNNIDKGVIYNADTGKLDLDDSIFEKYLETKAKEKDYSIAKMEADMREWKHLDDSGKYQTDTDFEKMLTGVTDWLANGRAEDMWNKLTEQFPLLKLVDGFARQIMEDPYTEYKGSNGYQNSYWTERFTGRKYKKDKDGNKVYID